MQQINMPDSTKDDFSLLLDKISIDPDIILVFDGQEGEEIVPAHATILKLHSPVLANALELAPSTSGCKRKKNSSQSSHTAGSTEQKRLHMPGTSKADFLEVAKFMYPVVPLPSVSWRNLEVLLVQGHKWDVPVVLAHAAAFVRANVGNMDFTPASPKYAFKWLQLTDAANLTDACRACIDHILAHDTSAFKDRQLESFSKPTLIYIVHCMGHGCKALPDRLLGRRSCPLNDLPVATSSDEDDDDDDDTDSEDDDSE